MARPDPFFIALEDARSAGVASFFDVALDALRAGREDAVMSAVAPVAGKAGFDDPRVWQVAGLAARALGDNEAANGYFRRASALAPGDALLLHSEARSALDAGLPASELFERALAASPARGEILTGLAAALLAEGRADEALDRLRTALAEDPGWLDGHRTFAQVAASGGRPRMLAETLVSALARGPRDASLWATLLTVLVQARRFSDVLRTIEHARARTGSLLEWDRLEAVALSELGESDRAGAIFDRLPMEDSLAVRIGPLRNLIRQGRYDDAQALADRPAHGADERQLWPYRGLLWRLRGDERWTWLEGEPTLVGTADLTAEVDFDRLRTLLERLHAHHGQPIDQSVSGGSQTDGDLLLRAEPEIRSLRAAILAAVADFVAALPPAVPGHPTLFAQRKSLKIAGSWSVRLAPGGFHVDHVHPFGWISSACYVSLPPAPKPGGESDRAGWLALGRCNALVPSLAPFREIEPRVGRLVLFPSIMWHGTNPFETGERLSVAFDIALPG